MLRCLPAGSFVDESWSALIDLIQSVEESGCVGLGVYIRTFLGSGILFQYNSPTSSPSPGPQV